MQLSNPSALTVLLDLCPYLQYQLRPLSFPKIIRLIRFTFQNSPIPRARFLVCCQAAVFGIVFVLERFELLELTLKIQQIPYGETVETAVEGYTFIAVAYHESCK